MSIRRATLQDIVVRCDRLAQQGQRLRPGQPPLAALDADGTLWAPDVAALLWQRLVREQALDRRAGPPLARALRECGVEPRRDPHADYEQLDRLHRSGLMKEETMVRAMLQGLAGLREEAVYQHSTAVVAETPELRQLGEGELRAMIDQLRNLGFRVVVVSGSPRWTVEVAVAPLGIEARDIVAGQVAVVGGVLTDGILEPLPWGKGKVQAILRRFGTVPRISMGNGLGDLPMLEATSDLRVLVNPSDDLMLACEEIRGATWTMGLLGLPAEKPSKAAVARVGGTSSVRRSRPTAST